MEIMESILTSIKKMLGITEEYEHFDSDLIIHINSVYTGFFVSNIYFLQSAVKISVFKHKQR